MLTRLEVSGFKTFDNLAIDLAPFLVIVGPNASGKSNLFDAIQLLSGLASGDLRSAVKGLRGAPHELFRQITPTLSTETISLAAEVLLNPVIQDPWGSEVKVKYSRVRYEVEIRRSLDDRGIERLSIAKEAAIPITYTSDIWRTYQRLPRPVEKTHFRYGRRVAFLSTETANRLPIFQIHQDGKQGRNRPAHAAEATVLSSITSAEFPHLFALREEFRSYRFLQLDPILLRRPSSIAASEMLESDGSNLATVLARIKAETKSNVRPKGLLSEIAADLSTLIPGVRDVDVELDEVNREYQVKIEMNFSSPFSSRVMSDGTLRVLALLTMLHDPKHKGLVCFEEPENGVHPARLRQLMAHLKMMVLNPMQSPSDSGQSLMQMLLNSHSPVAISALDDGDAVFADLVSTSQGEGSMSGRRTRVRPIVPEDQGDLLPEKRGEYVSRFEVNDYLSQATRTH